MKPVVFPVGIDIISCSSFMNCDKLNSVTFTGDASTLIDDDAFKGCTDNLVFYYMNGISGWDQTVLSE